LTPTDLKSQESAWDTNMHETYMKMAMVLAEKGRGTTSPNPMVGAVIVKNGRVIGEGFHEKAGGPHAEIHALTQAGENAREATLYVTLEPCNHTGRTPPCTEAILKSGIRAVVAGMRDPNPAVAGGGLAFLEQHGIATTVGVLEDACRRLNEAFVKYVTTGLPFVILKCASTLDGRIATVTGDSKWITNPRSREFVHGLRHSVDAIMVGIGTIKADNPSLTTRLEGVQGKDPLRVILDTRLSIPLDAKLLHLSSPSDTLIVTSRSVAPEKTKALEKLGARVLAVDARQGRIDLLSLMRELGRMEIMSLLIEGGSAVNGSALRAGIVDKVHMFFAPKICGGDGMPICAGPGVPRMDECIRLGNISVRRFEDDIMIEGYVVG
jgi:diaminohydroxyphosphoribosylaminopyrimidine deaminase/5-amino-6-(5-phosphoribosylamino)uracil reductase